MDHSNHHGILFPWLAIPSAEIHPGDGRHEKGAVRRVSQPRLVSGFTQSGTQRDSALSWEGRERDWTSRLPQGLCRYTHWQHGRKYSAVAPILGGRKGRHGLFFVRVEDNHDKAVADAEGNDSAYRQELAKRSLKVAAGNSKEPLHLSEGAARRGGLLYTLLRFGASA